MIENKNIWIFIEQDEGRIADVSLELVAKGRELADQLGSELVALLLGEGVEGLAAGLIEVGADRVLLAEDKELRLYRTLPYAKVLNRLIKEG